MSLIIDADYEPPETATPVPDDELVGAGEACRPVEAVPEEADVVPEDVAVLAVAPDEVVVVPGIV